MASDKRRNTRGDGDDLSPRPPFIVWRAARGVPPGFMPQGMEGRWDSRSRLKELTGLASSPPGPHAVGVRTSRIEHREDGASAEVWEVHPSGGNYPDDPADRLPLWET